jgi:hypothetical protein
MARDSLGFAYPAREARRLPEAPERFGIGDTFTTSIRVLLRNALPFGVITGVLGLPYLVMVIMGLVPPPIVHGDTFTAMNFGSWSLTWDSARSFTGEPTFPGILLGLAYLLAQCSIAHGSFQSLLGKPVGLGRSFARGLGAAVKVILAGILMLIVIALVVAAGVALCTVMPVLGFVIIPAFSIAFVALTVMWWVVVPVFVAEGGFIGCFRRSRLLTKGNRWGILALLLITAVVEIALLLCVSGIAMPVGQAVGQAAGQAVGQALAVALVLIFAAFAAVLKTVGYYKLRAGKEGIDPERLAAVFD